jgi:hypothetical protein
VALFAYMYHFTRKCGRFPHAGVAIHRQYEVTDTIEKLGGRKPKTFAEFVATEKLTFRAQAGS